MGCKQLSLKLSLTMRCSMLSACTVLSLAGVTPDDAPIAGCQRQHCSSAVVVVEQCAVSVAGGENGSGVPSSETY